MRQSDWFLYIVECRDKSLYTGITTDIKRRISEHNAKVGAKSLRSKVPVVLVYSELYNNHSEAAKREADIKKWTRQRKLKLIEESKI
jgi:putative endonuclease